MIREEEVYKIGKIGKPHGIKGEVTFMFDDYIFDRTDCEYLILRVDGILVPFFMEEYRFRSNETALVKFCDIDTQERARELTHCEVFFPRHLADSDDQEMTWAQLVGFQLVNADTNETIGIIQSVDDSTINILFEIKTPDNREILIPAPEELITNVDNRQRQIRMSIPDGLLSL